MRIGTTFRPAATSTFVEAADELVEQEKAGLDTVFVPELYSFDAVSQLGYLAARTTRVSLASSILPIYSRTPSLTAMTAAGLDHVSGGRFTLGIGTSGPQVIEGFHGVPFDAPLRRTREVVEICRQVWRREPVIHEGPNYGVPLAAEHGTGLGKPLKLIDRPVRADIPIMIAALGPRNVALTAEIAEAWQPIFYVPEHADAVWGSALAEGAAARDPERAALEVVVPAALAISENRADIDNAHAVVRAQLALYIGGMGAHGRNFYHDLVCRYGYQPQADRVQQLYLDGQKDAAAEAVPEELIIRCSLIGPESHVRERLAALTESGVHTVNATPLAPTTRERVRLIERLAALTEGP